MRRKNNWSSEATTVYTLLLAIIICGFIILEPAFPAIRDFFAQWIPGLKGVEFMTKESLDFMNNFIQWFGVLYGFLLLLLLVRVWEQFDKIDREFDREAETIKILYDDVWFSQSINPPFKTKILNLLLDYVGHVKVHYPDESEANSYDKEAGDSILRETRGVFHELIDSWLTMENDREALSSELLDKLNDAVEVRGNRISLCNQRIFESLRFVAMVISLVFALPFYFVRASLQLGFLDTALVSGVYFLVIFLLVTIEDLDEPYFGSFRISKKQWLDLHGEISKSIEKLEPLPDVAEESRLIQENAGPKKPRKARSKRSRVSK